MTTNYSGNVPVEFVGRSRGWEMLEDAAQRYLRMSAGQFIDAWYSANLDPERPDVLRVAMLLPFARKDDGSHAD